MKSIVVTYLNSFGKTANDPHVKLVILTSLTNLPNIKLIE